MNHIENHTSAQYVLPLHYLVPAPALTISKPGWASFLSFHVIYERILILILLQASQHVNHQALRTVWEIPSLVLIALTLVHLLVRFHLRILSLEAQIVRFPQGYHQRQPCSHPQIVWHYHRHFQQWRCYRQQSASVNSD